MLQALAFLLVFPYLTLATFEPICTHGFTLVKNRCLKLFHEPLSHKNAERVCSNFGATLVTIRNSTENLDVMALSDKERNVWIGLFCLKTDLSSCLWDDSLGSAEKYSGFESEGLNSEKGRCVTVNTTSGYWSSTHCEKEVNMFVCELPTTYEDTCQHNYNGFCYIPHSPKSFIGAYATCEKECGELASINSANENRYFNTLASIFSPNENVFILAVWPAFSPPRSNWDYTNMDPLHERVDACVVVSGERSKVWGYWYTTDCDSKHKFFCKRLAGKKCNGETVTIAPWISYTCNSSLILTPASVSSPRSQDGGTERSYCEYQVFTTGSNSIMMTFLKFDMHPSDDELTVYDGDSANSSLIGTFRGNDGIGLSLNSSGNKMFVTFRSNGTNSNWSGFEARFTDFYYASPVKKLI